MLKNFIKIAIRNFKKERLYSLINIFTLALGIASSLLITMYVIHESSFDDFHPDAENTYRVNMTNIWYPEAGMMSSTILPLAEILSNNYPEITAATRINTPGNNQVIYDGGTNPISFYEDDILAADSNFFEFFGFKLKEGNPKTALKGINKVVISEETAQRYFGNEQALGKTLLFGQSKTAIQVSGVAKKQPSNSHFDFDFLISMYTNPNVKKFEWSWIWTQAVTYVKVDPAADLIKLDRDFEPLARNHATSALSRLGMDLDEFEAEKGKWKFSLQPIQDIHLNTAKSDNRLGTVSDKSYIYIFSTVALLVILLAIINFMNLSTARASARAKEIGIRKVMGSLKKQLVAQFLVESVMMAVLATLVSFGIMELLKIGIQNFVNIQFYVSPWSHNGMLILIVLLPIALGVTAGLYPAFYLTKFQAAKVLKGELKSGTKSIVLRNVLVFLQFTVSITLMASTVIVHNQLQFVNNTDLGFNHENVVVVDWADRLENDITSFQSEIAKRSDVTNVAISMDMIGRGAYEDVFSRPGLDGQITMAMLKIDEHFLPTMNIDVIEGRNFSEHTKSDVNSIIINRAAVETLELEEGQVLGSIVNYFDLKFEVVGVVDDFNYQSLRYEISPFIFTNLNSNTWGDSRVVAIKTNEKDPVQLIEGLEQEWKKRTDAPFQYSFLDNEFETAYLSERRLGDLFAIFTVFAMIIACLGLFGLASYTVSQRNKEIGVRKVLGASVHRLVIMLNGDYSKIIILSILTAVPFSWWGMSKWLEQFAYKTTISWEVYLITGIGALAIAWVTVGYLSLKAAIVNPVDSLRDE